MISGKRKQQSSELSCFGKNPKIRSIDVTVVFLPASLYFRLLQCFFDSDTFSDGTTIRRLAPPVHSLYSKPRADSSDQQCNCKMYLGQNRTWLLCPYSVLYRTISIVSMKLCFFSQCERQYKGNKLERGRRTIS